MLYLGLKKVAQHSLAGGIGLLWFRFRHLRQLKSQGAEQNATKRKNYTQHWVKALSLPRKVPTLWNNVDCATKELAGLRGRFSACWTRWGVGIGVVLADGGAGGDNW